jgi:hypothetical protein
VRCCAQLGRRHGHVDGRLADHRPHPIDNLYLNAGWCYGGFKATPASGFCFAHLICATSRIPLRRFRLDRFARGYPIDEKGVRRPTQPALRTPRTCASSLSLPALRRPRPKEEFTYPATPR